MSHHHHTGRVNHVGLFIVGLVLLLAGVAALARGLGVRLLGPRHDQVVSPPVAAYAAGHGWFWPALAVLALVVELLALRWLLLQGRLDGIRYLSLEPDPGHGATHLSARAAASALEDDIEESMREARPAREQGAARGQRVRATLGGAPAEPRLALAVVLPDEADPAVARHGVHLAVTRLRESLETERLPATVRMHAIRTHF